MILESYHLNLLLKNTKEHVWYTIIVWGIFLMITSTLQGRSDKYLDSPVDGATIARDIYYRVVHSRKRLLSKFQVNGNSSFFVTACRKKSNIGR